MYFKPQPFILCKTAAKALDEQERTLAMWPKIEMKRLRRRVDRPTYQDLFSFSSFFFLSRPKTKLFVSPFCSSANKKVMKYKMKVEEKNVRDRTRFLGCGKPCGISFIKSKNKRADKQHGVVQKSTRNSTRVEAQTKGAKPRANVAL